MTTAKRSLVALLFFFSMLAGIVSNGQREASAVLAFNDQCTLLVYTPTYFSDTDQLKSKLYHSCNGIVTVKIEWFKTYRTYSNGFTAEVMSWSSGSYLSYRTTTITMECNAASGEYPRYFSKASFVSSTGSVKVVQSGTSTAKSRLCTSWF